MAAKRMKKDCPSDPNDTKTTFLEDMAMLAGTKPEGYGAFWRIIRAYDAQAQLPAADLALLINALRAFTVDGTTDKELQEFGRRAKLRGKQGRREPTAGEAEQRVFMVADVLMRERELVTAGATVGSARAQATREAAAKHHRSVRKVQQAIVEFGEFARNEVEMRDRLVAQIEQFREPARMAEKWLGEQQKVVDFIMRARGVKRADKS